MAFAVPEGAAFVSACSELLAASVSTGFAMSWVLTGGWIVVEELDAVSLETKADAEENWMPP